MKNTILKVLTGLCLMAAALVQAPAAFAVNSSDAGQDYWNQTANSAIVYGGANVNGAINLSFTNKKQNGNVAASTGAYITISATAMTFYQPATVLDASVGTAGVITYASTLASNTMGALCDYINSLGKSYICRMMNSKRNDPPVILKTQTATDGTNNLAAAGGLSVLQTTTTYVSLGIQPGPGKRVILESCTGNGNMGGVDSGLYVSGQLRKFGVVNSPNAKDPYGTTADDTYVVWTSTNVANTSTTQPSSYVVPDWIEFAQDAHVVVREGATGSTSVQTGSNFVQCIWSEK